MRKYYLPLLLLLLLTLPFRGMAALSAPCVGASDHAVMSMTGGMHDGEPMHEAADPGSNAYHGCSCCVDCSTSVMTGALVLPLALAEFRSPSLSYVSPGENGFLPDGLDRPPKHTA